MDNIKCKYWEYSIVGKKKLIKHLGILNDHITSSLLDMGILCGWPMVIYPILTYKCTSESSDYHSLYRIEDEWVIGIFIPSQSADPCLYVKIGVMCMFLYQMC